jgi:signal transduction histidine kinase/ActR/RegA family two-component response regulator
MGSSGITNKRLTLAIESLLISALYLVTGRIGFLLAMPPGNVTAVWPPSGIAFAAVIICGWRALPAVWLGSFLLNSWFFISKVGFTASGELAAFMIALGSTLQAAVGGWLLRKLIGSSQGINSPLEAAKFVIVTTLSCLVAPTIGVSSLCLNSFVQWSAFPYTWLTWWSGDSCGVLVFTTFAFYWRRIPDYLQKRERVLELIASIVMLVGVSEAFAFGSWSHFARNHFPFTFLFFPFLMSAAARFGASGVTLCVVIIDLMAVIATRQGLGPFVRPNFNDSLLLLQGFVSMVALSGLGVSAVLTEWLHSKDKLEKMTQELEDKVTERTAELAEANRNLLVSRDQAVEASNLKSAFVANMSHELRTPLSGIIGAAQMLDSDFGSSNSKELVQILHDSAQSLLKIVNEILDLSKLEAGKVVVEQEPFNLIYVVQDSARLMAFEANKKGIVLKTSIDHRIPELVRGDMERVRQTLRNLLGNAVKFTEAGEVSLEIALDSEDEKAVTILFNVRDSGIGISEDEQRLLFKPFTQVDASDTRKYGGTGLGLSICKRLVELMGGEIGVASKKDEGSVFWFKIPFARCIDKSGALIESELPLQPDMSILADKLVLIADDNAMIRSLVTKQLASLGMRSMGACDGQEAIDAVTQHKFDLILMDCQMPVIDGFEVSRRIRKMQAPHGMHTPIVALTAGVMPGDEEKCRESGMDDYLAKPASFTDLTTVLVRWIARTSAKKL